MCLTIRENGMSDGDLANAEKGSGRKFFLRPLPFSVFVMVLLDLSDMMRV